MQFAIVFFMAIFLLLTCHDNEQAARAAKAAEEARIEREVQRRVEVARQEIAGRDTLLHTVSMAGFILMAGGAVAGFLWVRKHRVAAPVTPANRTVQYSPSAYVIQQPRPQRIGYQQPRVGRVIDLGPVTVSPPVQQTHQPEQHSKVRQGRRRCWNHDPISQPDPPRRHHGTSPRS